MKLPKASQKLLRFQYDGIWYQIVRNGDKYFIYRCGDTINDYEQIGSGSDPSKLEEKVYSGKLR